MVASQVHLVRHGEVHNPDGILYGRLAGYHLSELGNRMAAASAQWMKGRRPITRLIASPLQRAQESAQPWAAAFGLPIETDERLIEPTNRFEGKKFEFGPQVLTNPASWPWVLNPFRPSWGEAYASIAQRMLAAIADAFSGTSDGDVVLVSHQLPICMVQRTIGGRHLFHDPRNRRCSLSSITTLVRDGDGFAELGYQDPAADLAADALDRGAV
ncbi:histidine phosphatase family protein [Parafrigoribacterium mesophilum]|uniref:histidine phosphatase family protein n=1 Tax=Parafrigoribacterium mesophilum TaxID=433646 RepID=UPI0031FC95F6